MEVTGSGPATPVKLVSSTVDGAFDWTFAFDLDVDVQAVDKMTIHKLPAFPLVGDWDLRVYRSRRVIIIAIRHNNLDAGQLGARVMTSLRLSWLAPNGDEQVDRTDWGPCPQPEKNPDGDGGSAYKGWAIALNAHVVEAASEAFKAQYKSSSIVSYRLNSNVYQDKSSVARFAQEVAHRHPDQSAAPLTNDVRIFFPRAGENGAEIWTDARLLSASSPYFEQMLNSEFAENVKIGAKRPRTRASGGGKKDAADTTTMDFDDSDDEADELLVKHRPPSFYDTDNLGEYSYRQIIITKTAFSTYSAVLRFLETDFIRFAPLSSACTPVDGSSPPSRADRITELVEDEPDLPFPVSPKSTFRLAHLLELDRLKRMSLAELRMQLSPSNASAELFDDASVCHENWRKVVLDYVVANWDAVSATASWKDITGRVDRDEVVGSGPILLAVMRAKGLVAV
ncbi:hypothetical protein JCM10450v2_002659 [Rhodotorula kratochvilovae]